MASSRCMCWVNSCLFPSVSETPRGVWRRSNSSRSAVLQQREAANTSIKSRGAWRSMRARPLVSITFFSTRRGPYGLWATGRQKISLRMSSLAVLPGSRVSHGGAGGQRGYLQHVHLLAACFQTDAQCSGDAGHGHRVLGGNIEVLAGAVHEVVRPDGITAGEDKGVRGERAITSTKSRVCSSGMSVTRLPGCGRRGGGKVSFHTARIVRPTRVGSTGHGWRSRARSR